MPLNTAEVYATELLPLSLSEQIKNYIPKIIFMAMKLETVSANVM